MRAKLRRHSLHLKLLSKQISNLCSLDREDHNERPQKLFTVAHCRNPRVHPSRDKVELISSLQSESPMDHGRNQVIAKTMSERARQPSRGQGRPLYCSQKSSVRRQSTTGPTPNLGSLTLHRASFQGAAMGKILHRYAKVYSHSMHPLTST